MKLPMRNLIGRKAISTRPCIRTQVARPSVTSSKRPISHLTRGGDAAHSLLEPASVIPTSTVSSPGAVPVVSQPLAPTQPSAKADQPSFKPPSTLEIPIVPLGAVTARPKPPARPLLPIINPFELFASLLAEPKVGAGFAQLFETFKLKPGETPRPRLYVPSVPRPSNAADPSTLPMLIYLPGIDGTGLAAFRQYNRLTQFFDMRALFNPPGCRLSFEDLVTDVSEQVSNLVQGIASERPVYLLGESFGGLLALAVAERVRAVDRVILANPATAFGDSVWPSMGPVITGLPDPLYRLLPIILSPIMANPITMSQDSAANNEPPLKQASDLAYGLLELLPQLSSLRLVLPAETLTFRLQLLREGAKYVNSRLGKVQQRVLLLIGENDLLIPSTAEAKRLPRAMPRCRSKILLGRSHAMLQEAGVDLVDILQEEGFYVKTRRLTTSPAVHSHPPSHSSGSNGSNGSHNNSSSNSSSSSNGNGNGSSPHPPPSSSIAPAAAAAATHHSSEAAHSKPRISGNNFGTPGPLELPSRVELEAVMNDNGTGGLRRLVSPVFFSTAPGGHVERGLGQVPAAGNGPVLYVGNHQLLATDMPFMIEQFLAERDIMLRGLAHPIALQGMRPATTTENNSATFSSFLETYGAVPVSGKNLYSLMAAGESALLYPGGVREAYKGKNEKYGLFWAEKAEFVRTAARFGATIIPFAAIGTEDCVNILLDSKEISKLPVIGDMLSKGQKDIPKVRPGQTISEDMAELFLPPVVSFNAPQRFYYLMGEPITTDPSMARDKAAYEALYVKVKSSVQDGLNYLLRMREEDPYKELLPRLAYEFPSEGKKRAPTFIP